jgi:hypothetical protein
MSCAGVCGRMTAQTLQRCQVASESAFEPAAAGPERSAELALQPAAQPAASICFDLRSTRLVFEPLRMCTFWCARLREDCGISGFPGAKSRRAAACRPAKFVVLSSGCHHEPRDPNRRTNYTCRKNPKYLFVYFPHRGARSLWKEKAVGYAKEGLFEPLTPRRYTRGNPSFLIFSLLGTPAAAGGAARGRG